MRIGLGSLVFASLITLLRATAPLLAQEGVSLEILSVRSSPQSFDTSPNGTGPASGLAVGVRIPLGGPAPSRPASVPRWTDGRRAYDRLLGAARAAQSNVGRDCYRTSARTAQLNGGSNDGWSWPEDRSYRGQHLSTALQTAIDKGTLLPGMVVYANRNPGTDPASMNLGNLPHWFTYLGPDRTRVHRFSDQYASDWSLTQIGGEYGGSRVIDAFYDPYK